MAHKMKLIKKVLNEQFSQQIKEIWTKVEVIKDSSLIKIFNAFVTHDQNNTP